MKIFLDDLIFSLQNIGGVSVYWRELLAKFNPNKEDVCLIKSNRSKSILKLNWNHQTINDSKLPLIGLRVFPLLVKLPRKSIFHSSYLRISLQKEVCNIVTIHDFATELGLVKGVKSLFKKRLQAFAINKADGIICVSESTKIKLIELYNVSKEKIRTIYHGCSDDFFKIEGNWVENEILYVGARNDYKNFETLVKVMSKLPNYKLVIVGGGVLSSNENTLLKDFLKDNYVHLLDIPTKELNRIYNSSFCLIYPSFYEGFGMPVVEAMKAACPVITTKVEALSEVAGESTVIINNPFDINEYLDGVKKLENADFRNDIITKGLNHALKFSWENNYLQTIAFYKEIFDQKFNKD